MGVLGVFLPLTMYTRSLYTANEIIVHLLSHGLHMLASLFWILGDCGGRFEKRRVGAVRIAYDILVAARNNQPRASLRYE